MGATAAIVGAGVALYGIYEQSQNSKDALKATSKESDRQYNQQIKKEKEIKDRQANADSLETSKIVRARQQALLFGGATKNNTIKTSPLGVSSTALGVTGGSGSAPSVGGKTLLGA